MIGVVALLSVRDLKCHGDTQTDSSFISVDDS